MLFLDPEHNVRIRFRRKFLLLSRTFNGITRWLEFAIIEEHYGEQFAYEPEIGMCRYMGWSEVGFATVAQLDAYRAESAKRREEMRKQAQAQKQVRTETERIHVIEHDTTPKTDTETTAEHEAEPASESVPVSNADYDTIYPSVEGEIRRLCERTGLDHDTVLEEAKRQRGKRLDRVRRGDLESAVHHVTVSDVEAAQKYYNTVEKWD